MLSPRTSSDRSELRAAPKVDGGVVAAGPQVRQRRPAAANRPEQVELEHSAPQIVLGGVEVGMRYVATRDRDEDVELAEVVGGDSDGFVDRTTVGDIHPQAQMVRGSRPRRRP